MSYTITFEERGRKMALFDNSPLDKNRQTMELDEVTKRFDSGNRDGNGERSAFIALKKISITIDMNQTTVLKGPSGSGKTTLLSIIGCMARPTTGRIRIFEREITSLPERFLSEIRRSHFGFIFQNYNLIKGISVLDNTMIPAFPTEKKRQTIKRTAIDLLDKLNMLSKAHQRVENLSGGEQQRVAIARALINDPAVIIADEPTAHLNTDMAAQFLEIVSDLCAEGKTFLIASHDPIVYEWSAAHRVIELRDGRIVNVSNKGLTESRRTGPTDLRAAPRLIAQRSGNDRRLGKERRSSNTI